MRRHDSKKSYAAEVVLELFLECTPPANRQLVRAFPPAHPLPRSRGSPATGSSRGPVCGAQLDGVLSAATFREAMANARKSVSKSELARYLGFKKELSGGPKASKDSAPATAAAAAESPGGPADADDSDEEELYD